MEPPLLSPRDVAGSSSVLHNPPILQAPEVPQLVLGMQAMSLSKFDTGQKQQTEEGKFALYMKVAATGGNPRVITLDAVRQQMKRAWRTNYGDIIRVHQYVFKASFPSFESMMWVFKRQPWLVGPDTMLLELADTEGEGYEKEQQKSIEQQDGPKYKFQNVYVTVRAYGIPWERRTLSLLADILRIVGKPSEFHELKDNMIFGHPDYVWGVVRHKVSNPVFDRIKLVYAPHQEGFTHLHYEKVGRICLFCGVMFHSIGNCHLRQSIITDRLRQSNDPDEVPFQRYGLWIIDAEKVPAEMLLQDSCSNPVLSEFQNRDEDRVGRLDEATTMKILRQMEKNRGGQSVVQEQSSISMDNQLKQQTPASMENQLKLHDITVHPSLTIPSDGPHLQHLAMQGVHVPSSPESLPVRGIESQLGADDSILQITLRDAPGDPLCTVQAMDLEYVGQQFSSHDRTISDPDIEMLPKRSAVEDSEMLPFSLPEEVAILQHGVDKQAGKGSREVPIVQMDRPPQLAGDLNLTAQQRAQVDALSYHWRGRNVLTSTLASSEKPPQFFPDAQLLDTPVLAHIHQTIPIRQSYSKRPASPTDLQLLPPRKRVASQSGNGEKRGFGALALDVGAVAAEGGDLGGSGKGAAPEIGSCSPLQHSGEERSGQRRFRSDAHYRSAAEGEEPGIASLQQSSGVAGKGPTSSTSRARLRQSRWDSPSPHQAGGNHGFTGGFVLTRPGSTSWHRGEGPSALGNGGPLRRSPSPPVGSMLRSSASPLGRSSPTFSANTADFDLWPLHSPSSPSMGTVDSRAGGFSPPPMAWELYVAGDEHTFGARADLQGDDRSQAQLAEASATSPLDMRVHMDEASGSQDMQAAAPAFKAPRAP